MIVDIHNHILPGLDDGPQNWGEMILLAEQAVENGITNVIATPHHKHKHREYFYENVPSDIFPLIHKANEILSEEKIPLTIHPGVEFHIHDEIYHDLQEKSETFLTLNDTKKFMLMEPPCSYYPDYTEDIFFHLQKKGFIPILAHPERNRVLRSNPEKIYRLVQSGVLIQITAASLMGTGKRLRNFSLHLLDHDLVHLIASDAHHHKRRKFELMDAYYYIERNYSNEYRSYLEKNAISVLKGEAFKVKKPIEINKKWQYFFFYNHPLNTIGI